MRKKRSSLFSSAVGLHESGFVFKPPATSGGNSVTPKQAKLNEVGARSNSAVSPTDNSPTVTQTQNVSSNDRKMEWSGWQSTPLCHGKS